MQAARELRDGKYDELKALAREMERRGYTATLDFPVNFFAKALADLRPEAKVLFTSSKSRQLVPVLARRQRGAGRVCAKAVVVGSSTSASPNRARGLRV